MAKTPCDQPERATEAQVLDQDTVSNLPDASRLAAARRALAHDMACSSK
jgi:hypothetical protein